MAKAREHRANTRTPVPQSSMPLQTLSPPQPRPVSITAAAADLCRSTRRTAPTIRWPVTVPWRPDRPEFVAHWEAGGGMSVAPSQARAAELRAGCTHTARWEGAGSCTVLGLGRISTVARLAEVTFVCCSLAHAIPVCRRMKLPSLNFEETSTWHSGVHVVCLLAHTIPVCRGRNCPLSPELPTGNERLRKPAPGRQVCA